MWGFHNGTPGCRSREYWTNGWNTVTGSTSSRLAPARPRRLDAGCGTGRNLVEFGVLGPAQGIDPSEQAVAFCRKRGLDHVSRARIEELPFEAASFDLLLACDVIEHVPDDARALAE